MKLSDGGSELPRMYVVTITGPHGGKLYRTKDSSMWSPVRDESMYWTPEILDAQRVKELVLEFGQALNLSHYATAKVEEVVHA